MYTFINPVHSKEAASPPFKTLTQSIAAVAADKKGNTDIWWPKDGTAFKKLSHPITRDLFFFRLFLSILILPLLHLTSLSSVHPFFIRLLSFFLSVSVFLREEEDDDIAHQFCCPASECSSPSSR